jgi:hypothetical protein
MIEAPESAKTKTNEENWDVPVDFDSPQGLDSNDTFGRGQFGSAIRCVYKRHWMAIKEG